MNMEQIYTYTGSFNLKYENEVLGQIKYVEDVSKSRKLYRNADFIRALGLNRNFTTKITPHYRFPGMRNSWSDWVAIKSALDKISNPNDKLLTIRSRKNPEESTSLFSIKKDTRMLRFFDCLPKERLAEALLSFYECRKNFSEWLKRFGENPERFKYEDLEKFSALDFLDYLKSSDIILKSEKDSISSGEGTPAANVDFKDFDGKNLQININIRLGK